MYKIHELREIIKLIDQSNIQEFELEHEGSKITLKKQVSAPAVTTVAAQPVQHPVQQPMPAEQTMVAPEAKARDEQAVNQGAAAVTNEKAKVEDKNLHQIKSPMVGTFYRKPSPDADDYVNVGDKINEKTIVCIVEAMKLFNEIEAEVKGEIVEVLVEDGQLVEYGQPLFLVKAN